MPCRNPASSRLISVPCSGNSSSNPLTNPACKPTVMKKLLPHIMQALIGGLFVFSGIGKVADTWTFVQNARQYVPELLSYLAIALPSIELLLGLALLLGYHTQQAARRLALLTLVYTLFYLYGLLFKDIRDCTCFGKLDWITLPPWLLLLRNGLLITITCWLGMRAPDKEEQDAENTPADRRLLSRVLPVIGAVAFAVSGYTYGRTLFPKQDNLQQWLGKHRAETPFATLPLAPDSSFLLFLFGPDCPHCWDAAANAATWPQAGLTDEVIPVTAEAFRAETERIFIPHMIRYFRRMLLLSDRQMHEAISKVPGTVLLRNDTVVYVKTGTVPSGFRLKHLNPYLKQRTAYEE